MNSVKKEVKKEAIKRLVALLKSGLREYTFDEILLAVPDALDLFDDQQTERLILAIQQHRIEKEKTSPT
jgi:hypothetical protein